MDIVIKKLSLYQNLFPTFEGEKFFDCSIKFLNPQNCQDETLKIESVNFLKKKKALIPEGLYLFLQINVKEEAENKSDLLKEKTIEEIKKAAEEIYLESLWQQLNLYSNQIYVRKLEEHSSPVIQLFWKLKSE